MVQLYRTTTEYSCNKTHKDLARTIEKVARATFFESAESLAPLLPRICMFLKIFSDY